MPALALTAIGPDRPGVVAALTGVLLAHEVQIADSQMGLLGGRCSLSAVIEPPDGTDVDLLAEDLDRIADDLGLDAVALHDLTPMPDVGLPDPTHVLTVYGDDHLGIVHAVAQALTRQGVEITDLHSRRLTEEAGQALCALLLEVAAPGGPGDPGVGEAMDRVAAAEHLEVVVRPLAVED